MLSFTEAFLQLTRPELINFASLSGRPTGFLAENAFYKIC